MDLIKKAEEFLKRLTNGKNKKKVLENSVIIIIIGVIIIIAGGAFLGNNNSKSNVQPETHAGNIETVVNSIGNNDYTEIEKKVEEILSKIEGAGRVSVLITYVSGKEIVPATDVKKSENSTNEKDTGGGTRSIDQNDVENNVVYSEEQGGGKKPVVIKELLPEVKGVVVVADGAADASVKEDITKAVQVLTGVPAHKVQVFERGAK